MPPITRWWIKLALVYFVAALWLSLILAARSMVNMPPLIAAFGPVYFHLFLVGWVTQLIFGVAYWMFPKYSREHPRGNEALAVATMVLLNVGLLLRTVAEPLNTLHPGVVWGWLLVLSAILQWLAGLGFVANTWGRVKEK
jgi:hypothetical protein